MNPKIKRCSSCKEQKSTDLFYKNKSRPDGISNECKLCNSKRRKRDLERRRPYMRDYVRKHYLRVQGKRIRIVKRPYPLDDSCELCGRSVKRLEYHHWDEGHPELGMWICWFCHRGVTCLERGLDIVYAELKKRITEE